jgi:hypothetical protein
MRAKLPLRISSIILLLFALGHTVGFQTFRPASQQGLEVMEAMRRVPFAFGSSTVHWMDLYTGFGRNRLPPSDPASRVACASLRQRGTKRCRRGGARRTTWTVYFFLAGSRTSANCRSAPAKWPSTLSGWSG